MKVILAGYNLDVEILRDIRERFENIARNLDSFAVKSLPEGELRRAAERAGQIASEVLSKNNLTPETLSAAYARISRLPLPIPDIRKAAREGVSRARRSNQQIVFEMGHKSIAEHAVYNFDILDISRLATEFIQGNRLCSFTEKSQRYIRFEEDVFIPPEIQASPILESYQALMHRLFAAYQMLFEALYEHLETLYPDKAKDDKGARFLQNMAGEDARYVLPLATFTQLGMTLNARALEWMAWKAKAHPLHEVRKFADELLAVAYRITPSLVKYTNPPEDYRNTNDRLKHYLTEPESSQMGEGRVRLLKYPEDGDDRLLALFLFAKSSLTLDNCLRHIQSFDADKKKSLFQDAMKGISANDPVWREFEALEFDIEVVLSASAYAQLKRHRMSSQLLQPYDPELGVVIPPSISAAKLEDKFLEATEQSTRMFRKISEISPIDAEYALTNAHQRRLLLHVNARELYHMARLRMDQAAQWEIRAITAEIVHRASEVCPLSMALATSKDKFDERFETFYEPDEHI
jgi:flavin-dependent thymidylate synthase